MKQTNSTPNLQKKPLPPEPATEVKKEDEVGGTWPNSSQNQSGRQATGRTGPIDDVHRDEYDEPGENAQANEPEEA